MTQREAEPKQAEIERRQVALSPPVICEGNCPTNGTGIASGTVKTLPCRVGSADYGGRSAAINRCPLWRGRLNRWILRRTLLGNPSDAEILRGAGEALGCWFDRGLPWGVAELTGNVRGLARRRPLELVGELGASARLLAPAPTMAGDSFASVAVEFFYFGRATDMPWPVLGSDGRWEPFDCTWAAELVGVPDAA